jgi:hypothetical protein
MVNLIASLYLVVSGAAGAAPVQVFTYAIDYDSVAACEEVRTSDENKAEVEHLRLALVQRLGPQDFQLVVTCKEKEAE